MATNQREARVNRIAAIITSVKEGEPTPQTVASALVDITEILSAILGDGLARGIADSKKA